MNFMHLFPLRICLCGPNLFDNNGIQSYIPYSISPFLSLKEVQVDNEIHEEDREDSYPCHWSMFSCHSYLLEVNDISKGNFQDSYFYDSSFNKETFSSYNQLLDRENSCENANDTSSTFITSHIFNSSQVNNHRQFDLFENWEFPI